MSSKSTLRLAVRVDASSAVGTGHVFRCLALTDEMRRMGSEIVYVCAEAPGHLRDLLIDKGYRVHMIAPDLSLASDAAAMRSVLALDGPFDWLLVDHYKLNADWERAAAGIASRIAAIDDLADRHHDVDLLIDSSHDASQAGLYENLVPLDAQLALGSEYVLLRREFFETPPPRTGFRGGSADPGYPWGKRPGQCDGTNARGPGRSSIFQCPDRPDAGGVQPEAGSAYVESACDGQRYGPRSIAPDGGADGKSRHLLGGRRHDLLGALLHGTSVAHPCDRGQPARIRGKNGENGVRAQLGLV